MYVMNVPVISTTHIRPSTAEFLNSDLVPRWPIVAAYDGGWFVNTEALEDTLPGDLYRVLQWAADNNYQWVRLDGQIGDIIEDLPNYTAEWE